jgi:hypothetical protein
LVFPANKLCDGSGHVIARSALAAGNLLVGSKESSHIYSAAAFNNDLGLVFGPPSEYEELVDYLVVVLKFHPSATVYICLWYRNSLFADA